MSDPYANAPLIVTAELPRDIFRRANHLRQTYYPPDRNQVDAHVTLFRTLPPSAEEEIRTALKRVVREARTVSAKITAIRMMGKAVVMEIDSPPMVAIAAILADSFYGLLTPQDQHVPRLHITVANKLTARESRGVLSALQKDFAPADFTFSGLSLHRYRGGPWDHVQTFAFR